MTSQEIKKRIESMGQHSAEWEIAYQLALLNENLPTILGWLTSQQPKRDADSERGEFPGYGELWMELARQGFTFSERYAIMQAFQLYQQRPQPSDPASASGPQTKKDPA